MKTDTEAQTTTVEPPESNRVLTMIERMAVDPTVDPAKLREILAVKQQWEADEARKAFAAAMATFQARCPIIAKRDEANGKMYARIDRIHRETRGLRSECGFWFVWNSCEIKEDIAHLDGILGHSAGHTVVCKQVIPLPEEIISGGGKKVTNAAQRAGSGMTYAKRYGECLALGIVTGDDNDANPGARRPASQQADGVEPKDLRAELWDLLAPVRGTENNWNTAKIWLVENDCVKADQKLMTLSAAELRDVIKKTKEKL